MKMATTGTVATTDTSTPNMNPKKRIQARHRATPTTFFHITSYSNTFKRIDGTDFDCHVMTTSS